MIKYSRVTVHPTVEPLTVAEAKYHCKVDSSSTEETDYFSRLIWRARRIAENYTGLSFLTQTREITLDYFPCGIIEIPYGPVQSITSFKYFDTSGVEQTLVLNTDFRLDKKSNPARLQSINGWPTPNDQLNAVTIVYVAGYTNVGEDVLPEEAVEMIGKLVARLYEKRGDEDLTPLTDEIMDIGDQLKVYWNATY